MSIFFEDEAQLSGTDSGDEGEDLLTPNDLLFLDDEDTQDNSPSFYRAIDRTPPLLTPHSPPPFDGSTEVEPSLPTDLSTPSRKRRTPELLPLDAPIVLEEPASKTRFQLQSKGIFLTYPQCPFPLDDFFENLKARFNDPQDQIYCSREQHEDGEWHLHACLLLHKQLRTRNVSYFDDLVDPPKHPNIQSKLKSRPKTIAYVMKGPDDSLKRSTHRWEQYLKLAKSKTSTKPVAILEIVNQHDLSSASAVPALLDQLDDSEHQAYLLRHLHQVRDYLAYRHGKALRHGAALAQQTPVRVRPALTPLTSSNVRIANWLNSAIRVQRPRRSHQIWIKAPPNAGKTTLILNLEEWFSLRVYYWPKDEKWWDAYEDGAYDLIVLDEFRSQKTITELNPILSGDPIPLSRRRSPPLVKRDNLPVMILSNFSPEECYHKCSQSQLAPLLDRLEFVEVERHVRIEKED